MGVLALLAGSGAWAVAPAAQGTPSIESYWKLDELSGTAAMDSSGNGHGATLMGGAAISTLIPPIPTNNQRSVALLNAVNNQHVNVPSNAAFDFTTGFTLACWVRLTGTPDTQMGLLERWSSGTTANNGYLFRLGRIGSPATAHHLKINVGNGTTPIEVAEYTAIPLNTWIHLATTWDGTWLKLYKNGAMVAQNNAFAGAVSATTVPLEIGQSGPHRLQGNIDEVYTFNTALTTTQVGILVNGQPPPTNLQVQPLVNALTVSWTAEPNAASYNVFRSDGGGAFTLITNTTSTSYLDTGATYPGTYAYQVTAIGFMESAPLGPVSGTPFSPIPRTNDHEEGLFGDSCACGSTIPLGPTPWAVLALLAAFRRRKR
ncbi:MAG TPA: LamG domain-containing protein [Planctomycetota bacterium]